MSITWPWGLVALLVVPLLLLVRWWMRRRRKRIAVRVASLALIRAALPGRPSWLRRIPVILFCAGLVVLGAGVARPRATVDVPSDATSILLTIDVSGSMCSTDVLPNRLTVASEAARSFIEDQRDGTRIGLVAFSGLAALLVPPTNDYEQLYRALDGLRTSRGTAIGLGILTAIDAIAEINPDVPPTGVVLDPGAAAGEVKAYKPDTIVVLTDGANTTGVDPITAAAQAQARRLRIYTIGFGTTQPSPMVCRPDQISEDPRFPSDIAARFGGFGGGGRYQEIDEETLTAVAEITGGEYYRAEDAQQLNDVLTGLPKTIVVQRKNIEITVWFVLAGALLVTAAVILSLRWNRASTVHRQTSAGVAGNRP